MRHNYTINYGIIKLAPMTMYDSDNYRILRNAARHWFGTNKIISPEQQRQWFVKYLDDADAIMFSIYFKERFVGGCSLYDINLTEGICEFGRIVVDKRYAKNKIGMMATEASLIIARNCLGINLVKLEVLSDNKRAIKIYERAGFIKKEECFINGVTITKMQSIFEEG